MAGLKPKAAAPFVHVKRARHGVRIRMRAAVRGRAHIRVKTHGDTVARAVRRLTAGRARRVKLRLQHRTPLRANVRVRLPGEHRVRVRRVAIRR